MALFDQINTDPEWVDWDKVEHGAEVFRRYKELYPYFGMSTFNAYGLETVAKPLALTGAYTGGSAFAGFWRPPVSGPTPPSPVPWDAAPRCSCAPCTR
ncbi:hypothetical protein OG762_01495 [Streptomyces sp. NBC_01136]|uniref:hypothetical protein n=1 Tax=unclassified Streptomyces TaxID=2593676 RepID=UPI003251EE17|nr:hypothetical protein OG762_01495 [Streptomyces sp. NBC_01136]